MRIRKSSYTISLYPWYYKWKLNYLSNHQINYGSGHPWDQYRLKFYPAGYIRLKQLHGPLSARISTSYAATPSDSEYTALSHSGVNSPECSPPRNTLPSDRVICSAKSFSKNSFACSTLNALPSDCTASSCSSSSRQPEMISNVKYSNIRRRMDGGVSTYLSAICLCIEGRTSVLLLENYINTFFF